MHLPRRLFLAFAVVALVTSAAVAQEAPFKQAENVVYAEVDGVGLVMDVFTPTGTKNGLGIVDVISGAWNSDRGKIRDHQRAQTFHILCRKGYTVFAIRPGSVGRFSVPEMIGNLNQGIRWTKGHSKEYGVDAERLGMMGASAGGHLTCLAAVTADDSTRVKAAAVFFPPTDFMNYGGKELDLRADNGTGQLVRRLIGAQGTAAASEDDLREKVKKISPALLVTAKAPPFLFIHGDADPLVPLQQSETMVAALKKAEVPVELIVKKGGGHPWPTMHEEVEVLANWFDKQLAEK